MSSAGIASSRGDEYQLQIALHWVIQMLLDDDIEGVQAESMGMPGDSSAPTVDDIVVIYRNGRRSYIQAKKNQPNHKEWSLGNSVLQKEIQKACSQLENDPTGTVWFYSRSPFGDLRTLVENSRPYPDYDIFKVNGNKNLKDALAKFKIIVDRPLATCFELCRRIEFGPLSEYYEWGSFNLQRLELMYAKPSEVRDILERRIATNQAGLRDPGILLQKEDIENYLSSHGHYRSLLRPAEEIADAFRQTSKIGRLWTRDIGGERIERPELAELIAAIDQRESTVLLVDQPGSGKTCLLLDVMDHIESRQGCAGLFIKGDQFTGIMSANDLGASGLPVDIIGGCSRLAQNRHVVVVIDSLDVLSLHRKSGTLHFFLGLMDRLMKIDNITLVVACREFDLAFDPLLRGRPWDVKVSLSALDFDTMIMPLLNTWGVDPETIHGSLRELLLIPQNLRIFHSIVQKIDSSSIESVFQLYDAYFAEVVSGDPELGSEVLQQLSTVAERMHKDRSFQIPATFFDDRASVLQRLISQNILIRARSGMLSFTHQDMGDFLLIRSAIGGGQTLLQFIESKLALPYIRPSVRTFFFYLRASDPEHFRRQVRRVLANDGIAYHLRRLIAESLAEILPNDDDKSLILWLLREHRELFERFLMRICRGEWLPYILEEALPEIRRTDDDGLFTQRALRQIGTLAEAQPEAVADVLLPALLENRLNNFSRAWLIEPAIKAITAARPIDVYTTMKQLVGNREAIDQRDLGRILQPWIEAAGDGDDVLWLMLDLQSPTESAPEGRMLHDHNETIHQYFIDAEFLQKRLCQSESLLTTALEYLLWSCSQESRRWRDILRDTSWRRHHMHSPLPHDLKHCLLDGIEEGLKVRAALDDDWWSKHELELREHSNTAVRYLVIQAYQVAVESNAEGIAYQITDPLLLQNTLLTGEIGQLVNFAYPYLSIEAQDGHQETVLTLARDETSGGIQRDHAYRHLVWIPRPYRSPDCQRFLDNLAPIVGPQRFDPVVNGHSGSIVSPVFADQFHLLSGESVIKLIKYFEAAPQDDTEWLGSAGMRVDRFPSSVRAEASCNPGLYMGIFDTLIDDEQYQQSLQAIIQGVTQHVQHRFGRLQPDKSWQPVEPVLDGPLLGGWLLSTAEQHADLWEHEMHQTAEIVAACCSVCISTDEIERIISALVMLQKYVDPAEFDSKDVSMYSVRGITARGSLHLYNRLIEKESPFPDALTLLLEEFSHNLVDGVREALLSGLAFTTLRHPDFGWALFDIVIKDASINQWIWIEPILYYNYHSHFDRVIPCLEILHSLGSPETDEVYGRIAMLSVLAGHIELEDVFTALAEGDDIGWQGACHVLQTNFGNSDCIKVCKAALVWILTDPHVPRRVLGYVHIDTRQAAVHTAESLEVVMAWLRANVADEDRGMRTHVVVDWLAVKVTRDALGALPIMEELASCVERFSEGPYISSQDKLVGALNAVLREADECDDEDLISRVLALQDRFMRLGVSAIDAMLDAASRP